MGRGWVSLPEGVTHWAICAVTHATKDACTLGMTWGARETCQHPLLKERPAPFCMSGRWSPRGGAALPRRSAVWRGWSTLEGVGGWMVQVKQEQVAGLSGRLGGLAWG